MCGLFGWKLSDEAMEKINLPILASVLALRAESRGDESWGVAKFDGVASLDIIKDAGSILETCNIQDIIAKQVIGHTRKATTGAIAQRNAHPFRYQGVIGAHNGYISNHQELNRVFQRNFEVDSQHIVAHIAEDRKFDTLDGMGTVTYLREDETNVVYLGRGQNSDLGIYGIEADGRQIGVVWASRPHWVPEALNLAGYRDYFEYDTEPLQEYMVDDTYELGHIGEFLLKYKPFVPQHNYPRQVPVRDYRRYVEGSGGIRQLSQNAAGGWTGPVCEDPALKAWREQYIREDGGEILVSRDAVIALPEPLKKTQEIPHVGQGEDSQVTLSVRRCGGCHRYGEPVNDHEEDAHGLVWHPQSAAYLCKFCTDDWDSFTGYAGYSG